MMRSAVKCAASIRVSALPLTAQPQVSIHNIFRHPFDLMKLYNMKQNCGSLLNGLPFEITHLATDQQYDTTPDHLD